MYWMNTVVNYCGPFEYEVGYCERLKNFLEANLAHSAAPSRRSQRPSQPTGPH